MHRPLLLAAALGVAALLPAPAAAHGHGPVHPNLVSSLDFRIILRDGPQVVHHRHPSHRYLKPQPWPLRFKHYAPPPRWHHFRYHQPRHYRSHDADRGHHQFKRGHQKGFLHAPGHRAKFTHRDHRPGFRRHR
jgi:hypothetical protein